MSFLRSCVVCVYGLILGTSLGAADPQTTRPCENDGVGKEWWAGQRNGIANDIKAMNGNVGLVFVGDSITARWRGSPESWNKHWGAYKPLNLGIGGDSTQHVLWRLKHGEIDGYQARLFVVMIGTNNMSDSPPDVAAGIKAILQEITLKQPMASILLLGIFPRGEGLNDRSKNAEVNKIISTFEGGEVHYMDIGRAFLLADGAVDKELMDDYLHLSPKGYEAWAGAIGDEVRRLMHESNTASMAGPGPYTKLAGLAQKIRSGVGLGMVLKTLQKAKEGKDETQAAEATMMFAALGEGGQRNLDAALSQMDTEPLIALALLERLATQFAGSDIGEKARSEAKQMRKDPKLMKEIEGERLYAKLQVFERELRPVQSGSGPESPQFRQANAVGIQSLTSACQTLITKYPDTAAAQKAEEMMNKYR